MLRSPRVAWFVPLLLLACGGQSAAAPSETPLHADETSEETAAPDPSTAGETKCQSLMTKLCADLGPTTETCELVKVRTEELSEGHCDEMMRHYPEVLAELAAYEGRNQPLPAAKVARMVDDATTSSGPVNASATIVVFSDFQCPFCANAATATHELQQRYGDKIRIVFRQFPLPFHRDAHLASQASLAANAQGKFWPMHDLLFENQHSLDRASLTRMAQQIGLNMRTFDDALDNRTYADAVDAELQLGIELGVDATPTMFLNGRRVQNASDVASLSAQIDALLTPTQ